MANIFDWDLWDNIDSGYYIRYSIIIIILAFIPVLFGKRDQLSYPLAEKQKEWHRLGLITRVIASLICPVIWMPVYAFYHWIVFDITQNILNGEPWNYVGKTSWIDRKTGKWNYPLKIVGLILSLIITIWVFQ